MKYIVDIHGELEGDYEIIGKYEEKPQGDLISRSALKERIQLAPNKNYETWDELYDSIIYEIDNAPTVETKTTYDVNRAYDRGYITAMNAYKRPKGEWIVLVDADNIQTCKCSICGRIADIANREFDKFPYCHCGAKMKGGADMRNITETSSSCTTTNPNSVEVYHQSLKGGAE